MPKPIRTIVVGVASLDDQDPRTGAGDADPVLAPTVRLAVALGAELHVVHAFEVPEELASAAAGPACAACRVQMLVDEVEERLEAQLAAFPGGDAVHCRAVQGPAAERLCAVAEEVEADLLVVGASRRGRLWSGILGSTAGQLLVESAVPVLVVHRPFGAAVRRVLLATDFSVPGAAALGRALDLVNALSGRGALELRCLHVVERDALLPARLAAPALEAAGRERLERYLADSRLDGLPVEGRVRVGDPAREIVYEATEWDADLLVLATHAHPEQGYRPLGRVAFATIRGASCNVLAIPAAAGAVTREFSLPWTARVPEASVAAG